MTVAKPGEWVMQSMLRQLTIVSKVKIEKALENQHENNLMKSMHLNDDPAFEQLISAFTVAAEFALPSLLNTVVQWYRSQHSSGKYYHNHKQHYFANLERSENKNLCGYILNGSFLDSSRHLDGQSSATAFANKSEKNKVVLELSSVSKFSVETRVLCERRDLPYHPGHNDIIELILDQCFRRFNYREDFQPKNSENINLVADLYAEIVGLLSQSRFALVRCKFMHHLNELRSKENNPTNKASIVSLIMGMKFFRVKMHPIEDFVNCFTFLQELGQYFLEVKEVEIKHVLSDLFVEILLPVAAVARQEVNIPALKTFVENIYPTSLELANKKKHVPALFPLVTCLLCVGTKSFFLSNWTNFMSICLSHLKNRTSKVALVSLQSLSCLLWVYIVRIKGEKHSETQSKLHTIINSLFPKNQKFLVPKDAPINIFVRIIQFIAHEKLEFAVKEVIIDRLGVNGLQKTMFMPERMNVGLCAFLLIAHGLQQKEGEPPMPQQSTGAGGVGAGFRQAVLKRSFHGTNLNDALGHTLGIQAYLIPVRRAFEHILRQLDMQVCRTMMLPKQEVTQKEFDELMTADRKPKLDLLKTCVACIPRLLPNDMSKPELLELLAKVCLHVDEDVRKMAQQAMANLIVELPGFRVKTIQVFIQFIQRNVADTSPNQLDSCLKTLFHLLNNWKLALQKDGAVSPNLTEKAALHEAEGFALIMLCHCRMITRRLAVHILRKCRALLNLIHSATCDPSSRQSRNSRELCCIDILDRSVPIILKRLLPLLPLNERSFLSSTSNTDFSIFTDRSHPIWSSGALVSTYSPIVLPANYVNNQFSNLINVNGQQQPQQKPQQQSSNTDNKLNTDANSISMTGMMRPSTGDVSNNNSNGKKNDDLVISLQGNQSKSVTRTNASSSSAQTSPCDFQTAQVPKLNITNAPVIRRPSQYHQQVQHAQQAYIMQPTQDRAVITDIWGTCLSVVFSQSALPAHCSVVTRCAWPMLFQRISQLFPLVDPSAQIAENRASSLLRTTSKKPTNEREQLVPLWHNYVVLGSCIAPSSTGIQVSQPLSTHYQPDGDNQIQSFGSQSKRDLKHYRDSSQSSSSQSDESSNPGLNNTGNLNLSGVAAVTTTMTSTASTVSSSVSTTSTTLTTATSTSSTSFNSSTPFSTNLNSSSIVKENARDLIKFLVPLLRCEQTDMRDSAIAGLGRINPAAFRDVLEDLQPLLKESVDKKQENMRRRRRRDILRVSLVKVLALMAQSGIFAYPESNVITPQGSLIPQLIDYLDGMRCYLESVSDQLTSPSGHTHTSSGSGASLGSLTTVGSSQPMGIVGNNTASQIGNSVVSGTAATPISSSISSSNQSSSSFSTEYNLLNEIRLHFCIFIKELIRNLPRTKRTNLLPSTMRYQMFILLSHWSGHNDHVLGTYNDSEGPILPFPDSETHISGQFGPSENRSTDELSSPVCNTNLNQSPIDSSAGISVAVNNFNATNISSSGVNVSESTSFPIHVPPNCCAFNSSQKSLPSDQNSVNETWEYCLWIDLVWSANQAMAALVCCGPIFDRSALLPDNPTSLHHVKSATGFDTTTISNNERTSNLSATSCYPSPGYVLRWISGLLVARDTALSSSPWLWFCPIVNRGLLYNTLSPGGASLCGNSQTRSRAIVAGGGRRLDSLLRQLGEETLVLLLDFNPNCSSILNWIIDQCYTATNISLSTACFTTISLIVNNMPNFTFDHIILFTLAFIFIEHPLRSLSDRAFYLLRVLYHRFIIEPGENLYKQIHSSCKQSDQNVVHIEGSVESNTCDLNNTQYTDLCTGLRMNRLFWQSLGYWTPSEVVRQFAAQHPDFTLMIFSEITRRIEKAREGLRVPLLRLLSSWLINVELVDLIECDSSKPCNISSDVDDDLSDNEKFDDINFKLGSNGISGYSPDPFDSYDLNSLVHKRSNVSQKPVQNMTSIRESENEFRARISRRHRRSKSLLPSRTSHQDLDSDHDSENTIQYRNLKSLSLLRRRARQAMHGNSNVGLDDDYLKSVYPINSAALWSSVPLTLRSKGWGSKRATELVLTNLFYITLRLADCPTSCDAIKQAWIMLIRHRPSNLRVILRYLIIVTSLAPATLFVHAKRLITYLAYEQPENVIEELMVEMQTIDGVGLIVEPIQTLPFFHISTSTRNTNLSEEQKLPRHNYSTGTLLQTGLNLSKQVETFETIGQPDAEVSALGLGNLVRPLDQTISKYTRTLRSALSGRSNRRQSINESSSEGIGMNSQLTNNVRPKSATSQPTARRYDPNVFEKSKKGTIPIICSTLRNFGGRTVTSTGSPKLSQTCNTIPVSECKLIEGSDGELEIDIDSLDALNNRVPSLDDKYATLRAKDIAHLLIDANSKDGQFSDTENKSIHSPSLYLMNVSPTPNLRESKISEPMKTNANSKGARNLKSQKEFYNKRFKSVNYSKIDMPRSPSRDIGYPIQSVSLPPSLASLPPLPLPLPTGISSILSLPLASSVYNRSTANTPPNTSDKINVSVDQKGVLRGDKSELKYPLTVTQPKIPTPDKDNAKHSVCNQDPKPLPLPKNGGYHAPLGSWLSEPLVIGGSVVYTGNWPPAGARSPIVLLLAGSLTQVRDIRIDWNRHLPTMLLGVFLGIDHCRALVQEECKQLIVSLLHKVCPEHDSLHLLRLELEASVRRLSYPSAFPGPRFHNYRLTPDGGPFNEKFDLIIDPCTSIQNISFYENIYEPKSTEELEVKTKHFDNIQSRHSASPPSLSPLKDINITNNLVTSPSSPNVSPPIITGFQSNITPLVRQGKLSESTFSLISTTTLIPRTQEMLCSDPHPCCGTRSSGHLIGTHFDLDSQHKRISPNPSVSSVQLTSHSTQTATPIRLQPAPAEQFVPCADARILTVDEAKNEKEKSSKLSDPSLLKDAIQKLRSLLLESSGQAIWTWDDFSSQRNQTLITSLNYCQPEQTHSIINSERQEFKTSSTKTKQPSNLLEKLVKLVARILALSEAGPGEVDICLQCHHGPPHNHGYKKYNRSDEQSIHTVSPPNFCIVTRFSQAALNTGLSCPNRHYASRSLQIYRALGAHLDANSLSHLLARLGETISDPNEEMQGYVAELFLTQEAAIYHLQSKSDSIVDMSSVHNVESSSPCLTTSTSLSSTSRKTTPSIVSVSDRRHYRHSKSSSVIGNRSCNSGIWQKLGDLASKNNQVTMIGTTTSTTTTTTTNINMTTSEYTTNSQSEQIIPSKPPRKSHTPITSSLKSNICLLPPEERADLIIGIFWTGVFLLDSDFEHEYLAGLKLLGLVLPSVCSSSDLAMSSSSTGSFKTSLNERAQKMLSQLHWNPYFPGILSLVIKGCSSLNLVDPACRLLVNLIPFLNNPLVVPSGRLGLPIQLSFPIVLITLMPMLIAAWDEDPLTTGPVSHIPCDASTEQLSFLQGGFLGRGVCSTLIPIPRALGSWTSCSFSHTSVGSNSMIPSNRGSRTDSMGYLSNCLTGGFGVNSVNGSITNLNSISFGNYNRDASLPGSSVLRPKNPVCIQAAEALAQAAFRTDPVQFHNLALVLRLYAAGTFSKDVDQWTKCVVCYLLDGCAEYAPRLLKHMNMLLLAGPPCLQLPLLKIVHLFLQQIDLTQPGLETPLRLFIDSVVNQFLGTSLWPEVTPIIQVIVSRSAVLSAVPPANVFSLPGLDPSGSGRVLDLAAAAAAVAVPLPESEPPRLELSGPVLDFKFNVFQEAPLLAPQYASNSSASALESLSNTDVYDYTSNLSKTDIKEYLDLNELGLNEMFITAAGNWNKPGVCQHRLRERLYHLVGCYGLPAQHCIGAPRSPSVIFSQSTETLDPQLSVHSSSETTSMIDVSNPDDIRLDETSSGEQAAVFRDLDTYLDAQLMNINFLGVPDYRLASTSASMSEDEPRRPWGVRGQAITCHFDLNGDKNDSLCNDYTTNKVLLNNNTPNLLFTGKESLSNNIISQMSRNHSFPHLSNSYSTSSNYLGLNRRSTCTIMSDNSVNAELKQSTIKQTNKKVHTILPCEQYSPTIWQYYQSDTVLLETENINNNDNTYDYDVQYLYPKSILPNENYVKKYENNLRILTPLNMTSKNINNESKITKLPRSLSGNDINKSYYVINQILPRLKLSNDDLDVSVEPMEILIQNNNDSKSFNLSHSNENLLLNNLTKKKGKSNGKFASTNELSNKIIKFNNHLINEQINKINRPKSISLYDENEFKVNNQLNEHNHYFKYYNPDKIPINLARFKQIQRSVSTSDLYQNISLPSSYLPVNYNKELIFNKKVQFESPLVSDRYKSSISSSGDTDLNTNIKSKNITFLLDNADSLDPIRETIRENKFYTYDDESNIVNNSRKSISFWLNSPTSITNDCSPDNDDDDDNDEVEEIEVDDNIHDHELNEQNHIDRTINQLNPELIDHFSFVKNNIEIENDQCHLIDPTNNPIIRNRTVSDSQLLRRSLSDTELNKCQEIELFANHGLNDLEGSTTFCISSSKRSFKWKNPSMIEQKWLEYLPKLRSDPHLSTLKDQFDLISTFLQLPHMYRELLSRYLTAIYQVIHLSGYSWAGPNDYEHLVHLAETMMSTLRPPWFYYNDKNYLSEENQAVFIRGYLHIMEMYEKIQDKFEQITLALDDVQPQNNFQIMSQLIMDLINFVEFSHSVVELVYNNFKSNQSNDSLSNWSDLFHDFMNYLVINLQSIKFNDNNNYSVEISNLDESLVQIKLKYLLQQIASSYKEQIKLDTDVKLVILCYRRLMHLDSEVSKNLMDELIEILNYCARQMTADILQPVIIYLPLPVIIDSKVSTYSVNNYCDQLQQDLQTIVKIHNNYSS